MLPDGHRAEATGWTVVPQATTEARGPDTDDHRKSDVYPCSAKRPIVLLLDYWVPVHNRKYWLQTKLEDLGLEVHVEWIRDYDMANRRVRWRKLILWKQYFQLGLRGARIARARGGIVVAWNFIPGAFAALVSRLRRRPGPPVVGLNMIYYDKGRVLNSTRSAIYRFAGGRGHLLLTVSSHSLRRQYVDRFGFRSEQVSVLHDAWQPEYPTARPSLDDGGYVFSGGEAARDWGTLLSVARACPHIPFKVVARRMRWKQTDVPRNVQVRFDTSEEEFYSLAAGARLVLLPLLDRVTSGLIVLVRSVLLGRPVLGTQTPGMMPYFPADCRDLLVGIGDAEQMASKVQHYWNDPDLRLIKAQSLQDHVIAEFSPDAYARQVADLVAVASAMDHSGH